MVDPQPVPFPVLGSSVKPKFGKRKPIRLKIHYLWPFQAIFILVPHGTFEYHMEQKATGDLTHNRKL